MTAINTPRLIDWALDLAGTMARRSKDPSTQVGAIIFDAKGRLVSGGFNGLPRGVSDTSERLNDRPTKYRMIRHAEANALAFATASTEGCTLVVTHPCCAQCAGAAIQAGISTVIYPQPCTGMVQRWGEDLRLALQMFREAGVTVIEHKELRA